MSETGEIIVEDNVSKSLMATTRSIDTCFDSFRRLQEATKVGVAVVNINQMRASLANTTNVVTQVSSGLEDASNQQEQLNEKVKAGDGMFDSLKKKAAGLVSDLVSIENVKAIVNLSDNMTQTTTRLGMMNDGLQTTEQLQQKLFQSAQNSRTPYLETAAAVTELANNASNAFGSNDEMIGFAELVNKQFAVAGLSSAQASDSFSQLTQAMGSGVLSGEDLNSIFGQTPDMVQTLADYLNVPIEKISEMASGGEITSDVVKNAMFSAADGINEKFSSMPMTWGQVATSIQNQALMAFQPILTKINEIANSEKFQTMASSIANALSFISEVATYVLDLLGNGASWIYDNWSSIGPIVLGVAFAIGTYFGLLAIGAAVQGAIAIGMTAYHIACVIGAIAVRNLTVAQTHLNLAMLGNPIAIIAALIVGILIFALVRWIQSVGDLKLAWLIAMDNIKTAIENFHVGFMKIWYGILTMLDLVKLTFQLIGISIANYVGDMRVNVLMSLQNMVNGSIGLINNFIEGLNKISGINIEAITTVSTVGTDAAAEEAKKQALRWESYNANMSEAREKAVNRDADLANLQAKYDMQQADRDNEIAQRKIDIANKSTDEASNPYGNGGTENASYPYGNGNTPNQLENISNNTAAGADNTGRMADSMEITEEDLKYLRDIAEREIIDRTVFRSLKVDMGGISNTVNNMTDLDGIGDYLGDVIVQTASMSMEGVG